MVTLIPSRVSALACMFTLYLSSISGQCYYPGGDLAIGHLPCDIYAFSSACCPHGWTCLSNHLCVVTDPGLASEKLPVGTAFRPTCTNPLWNNTTCGNFCLRNPVDANNGSLVSCGHETWCCEPDVADERCNCGTGKGTFSLPPGLPQTIIGINAIASTIAIPSFSTATIGDNSASPTIITSLVVKTTVVTATTHASFTAFATITPLTGPISAAATTKIKSTATDGDTQPSSTPSSMPSKITSTTAFKAGVGATVPAISLLLVGLLVCYSMRKHRRWPWRTSEGVIPPFRDPDLDPLPFQAPEPFPHPYYRRSNDSRRSIIPDRVLLGRQRNTTPTPPLPGPSRGFTGIDSYNSGPGYSTRQAQPLLSRGGEGVSPPPSGWPLNSPT